MQPASFDPKAFNGGPPMSQRMILGLILVAALAHGAPVWATIDSAPETPTSQEPTTKVDKLFVKIFERADAEIAKLDLKKEIGKDLSFGKNLDADISFTREIQPSYKAGDTLTDDFYDFNLGVHPGALASSDGAFSRSLTASTHFNITFARQDIGDHFTQKAVAAVR